MPSHVAVIDPLPTFRSGLAYVLDAAPFVGPSYSGLDVWAHGEGSRLLFLTICAQEDWQLLKRLNSDHAGLMIIVLLEDDSVPAMTRALAAGAVGILRRDADLDQLRKAAVLSSKGLSLLPISVVRALTGRERPSDEEPLSIREKDWLKALAKGESVAAIALRAGYSERMMFRYLAIIYRKLGAGGRSEAITAARSKGWL